MILTAGLYAIALLSYGQVFTVKGRIDGIDKPVNVTLTLSYGGKELKEVSRDGSFSFKGSLTPGDVTLKLLLIIQP